MPKLRKPDNAQQQEQTVELMIQVTSLKNMPKHKFPDPREVFKDLARQRFGKKSRSKPGKS